MGPVKFDEFTFHELVNIPLVAELRPNVDLDVGTLADVFRGHVLTANEVFAEVRVQGSSIVASLMASGWSSSAWKSIAQPPSPAPLCKRTQSSYILLTSLKRCTTRSRGLSVAYQ